MPGHHLTAGDKLGPIVTRHRGKSRLRWIGDDVGNGVTLVSMSVDPIRDTPQRMKAYSAKHNAGDGWHWLTGPKPVVDEVLVGLGAYTTNFEDHPTMVLIGDGKTGEWQRLFGFPNPDRIVQIVNDMRERRESGG